MLVVKFYSRQFFRIVLLAALCSPIFAGSVTMPEIVSGVDGPWSYVNGGLNTAYQYGIHDQAGPMIVDAAKMDPASVRAISSQSPT